MTPQNQFWSSVHRLAVAYDAEGLTPEDRVKNLVREFREMPAFAQRELLLDLFEIVERCTDIYTLIEAAANARDRKAIPAA